MDEREGMGIISLYTWKQSSSFLFNYVRPFSPAKESFFSPMDSVAGFPSQLKRLFQPLIAFG